MWTSEYTPLDFIHSLSFKRQIFYFMTGSFGFVWDREDFLHGSWYSAVFWDENNVGKHTDGLGFAEQSLH